MKVKAFFLFVFITLFLIPNLTFSAEKDLRPLFKKYNIGIYEQGKRGTCSVFAMTGIIEFEYANNNNGEFIPLSVEYLNWASDQISGAAADGTYFSDAMVAMQKYGICEDSLFPYYIQNYNVKVAPSKAAIKDAKKRRGIEYKWIKEWNPENGMTKEQLAQVKQELINEHPVAIGFRWPKKDGKYRKIINGMMYVPPEEGVFDGHSVMIVGFKDDPGIPGGGYLIFKNSHGEDYGENGYLKMPYEYVEKYANDGIVVYLK